MANKIVESYEDATIKLTVEIVGDGGEYVATKWYKGDEAETDVKREVVSTQALAQWHMMTWACEHAKWLHEFYFRPSDPHMTLKVKEKTVYGNTLYYPDDEMTNAICSVLGQRSLSKTQVKGALARAFDIDVYSAEHGTHLHTITSATRSAELRDRNAHKSKAN